MRNEEWICRTIRPGEYKSRGVLKAAFVQTSQLDKGHLSAWRLDEVDRLPDLANRLVGKMSNPPENLLAVQASLLRNIRLDDQRAICVINDTRVDMEGGHDQEHVALSPCARFAELDSDEREAVISQLKTEIIRVYRGFGQALRRVAN